MKAGEVAEKTKFAAWVMQYGVADLVYEMKRRGHSLTTQAVYQWLWGTTEPVNAKQRDLVRISNGAIRLEDIHDHIEQTRSKKSALA
jgi:hypothetical protein